MPPRAGLFALIFLLSTRVAPEFPPTLIVWNVGQGQWATVSDDSGCWHFDLGGEFAPWSAIMRECRDRPNFISLSHWDWDHVSFVGRARFYLPNICLVLPPQGHGSPRKERGLAGLGACPNPIPFFYWNGEVGKSANTSSRVVSWRGILLPGDSPRDQEKRWSRELPKVAAAKILVLGHHGSATSTGEDLLARAAHLRLAIASARFKRYGHPHVRVRRDLEARKIPLLRTEDWGTVRLSLTGS